MLGIIMLSVIIESYYNGCHSANCHHPAGCHYGKCHGTFPPPSKSLQIFALKSTKFAVFAKYFCHGWTTKIRILKIYKKYLLSIEMKI
jgi:hypothetical protein